MKEPIIFDTLPFTPEALARIQDHGIRVVGDVHGDLNAFQHAARTDRFVLQLGDLVDHGPDSVGVMELMLDLLEQQRGLFILGNHDRKLGRALEGRRLRRDPPLEDTLQAFSRPENATLREQTYNAIAAAPAWVRFGRSLFVHGGFHTAMLMEPPPPGLGDMSAPLSRALFGETTGRLQPDGYPERRLTWINRIPAGMTVYVGHDRRSTDGRPWHRTGRLGGTAIFTDLGAGKGGHLAWIDLNSP